VRKGSRPRGWRRSRGGSRRASARLWIAPRARPAGSRCARD
jgi:hypothetical protein